MNKQDIDKLIKILMTDLDEENNIKDIDYRNDKLIITPINFKTHHECVVDIPREPFIQIPSMVIEDDESLFLIYRQHPKAKTFKNWPLVGNDIPVTANIRSQYTIWQDLPKYFHYYIESNVPLTNFGDNFNSVQLSFAKRNWTANDLVEILKSPCTIEDIEEYNLYFNNTDDKFLIAKQILEKYLSEEEDPLMRDVNGCRFELIKKGF